MDNLNTLLENNAKWSDNIKEKDPNFFNDSAKEQTPNYLWIGCSDSRVPPNQILSLQPGELFVHRNIANIVDPSDINCMSVVQYAVDTLKVKHILVCGHYGCGGVAHAASSALLPTKALPSKESCDSPIDDWLAELKVLYRWYKEEIPMNSEKSSRQDLICELNVLHQTHKLCHTDYVTRAWHQGHALSVHALIYDLKTGKLKSLDLNVSEPVHLDQAFKQAVESRIHQQTIGDHT